MLVLLLKYNFCFVTNILAVIEAFARLESVYFATCFVGI